MTTTKKGGSEISWTLGTCISAREYQNHHKYAECCCLESGSYQLVCKDRVEDGWDGGFIEIQGKRYCEDFSDGSQQEHDIEILGKLSECINSNSCEIF